VMMHRSRQVRTRPDRFASLCQRRRAATAGGPQRSDAAQAIAHALTAGQEFPFMRA
jgi:hypothetical protein